MRPGITGLWQVSGRSDLSWSEAIRLDLYYVENWSLVGDVVLLRDGSVMLSLMVPGLAFETADSEELNAHVATREVLLDDLESLKDEYTTRSPTPDA